MRSTTQCDDQLTRSDILDTKLTPYHIILCPILWIFTTLEPIVVFVIIGFLIGIVRALESIDDGLATASNSVAGATGNVEALPDYIQGSNSALSDIDATLKPIRGRWATSLIRCSRSEILREALTPRCRTPLGL